MHILYIVLSVLQMAFAIALIFVVVIQETKSTGLGGAISGKAASTFKGKPGFEDRLNEMTRYIGVGFFVLSLLVAVTMNR